MVDYEIRAFRPGDERSLLATFNQVFGERDPAFVPRTIEQWEWAFLRNPAGTRIWLALQEDQVVPLDREAVRGITHRGGTILGTTNRGNPFSWPVEQPDGTTIEVDRSSEVLEAFERLGLDALIVVGGDGSLHIAHQFWRLGLPVVGVPKTIDNDVRGTVVTFGFDTAVTTATEA